MNELKQTVTDYLAAHQVMTLATHDGENVWAAAVFYVNNHFSFYFLSAGHTRHAKHISSNPFIAATIQEDYSDWQDIKGIQMSGKVKQIQGSEKEQAIMLYHSKYPFVFEGAAQIAQALTKVNWYVLKPNLLYFIDNSKGLGHRDNVPLF